RPHRYSCILEAPETVQVVPLEVLQRLAARVPRIQERQAGQGRRGGFDVAGWLQRHGVTAASTGTWEGGTRYILNPCPWDPSHTNGSAYVVQFPTGGIAAGCHHNSCQGQNWRSLRDLKEPGWREGGGAEGLQNEHSQRAWESACSAPDFVNA